MDEVFERLEKLRSRADISDELSDALTEVEQSLEEARDSESFLAETLGSDLFEPVDLSELPQESAFANLEAIDVSEVTDESLDEELPVAVEGRYEDLGLITRGGMGEIRRVRDRDLNRIAVMKVIRADRQQKTVTLMRFVEEAQITAQLAHPGIPAVHELGQLDDGRLYFTMREVRGRTLEEVIEEVHLHFDGDLLQETHTGWSLRGLIEALEDVCSTLGFAHARGVVHRDLKPQNIMVGKFDVVQVLDWGIAKVAGRSATHPGDGDDPLDEVETSPDRGSTRAGAVMGTAAYMAPEQVRGEPDRIQPATDVFALGVLLYEMLTGRPPFRGDATLDILLQILEGPEEPIDAFEHVPEPLARICQKALSADPSNRFENAAKMGEAIEDWLEGTARRERAQELLIAATDIHEELVELRQTADWLERRSRDQLKQVAPNAPVDAKQDAWQKQERARKLRRKLARREVEYVKRLRGALNHAPNLEEARRRLADYYRAEHERAERAGDDEHAEEMLAYLEAHDDGRYADYLTGRGRLSLACDAPKARASLFRFEERHRRLVPEFVCELGPLPLEDVELARGSYLVRINSPDTIEVDYPVRVEREEHWRALPPGRDEPQPVHLPERGTIGGDEVYVPGGWFTCGGDERAPQSLDRKRIWIDGFVIQRYPVTHRDYLIFLNALVTDGRADEALEYAPTRSGGVGGPFDGLIYERTDHGMFVPPADEDFVPDRPVSLIDWYGARAYAQWLRRETALPWRLPSEFEWEKAARGVDERSFPWGDFLDPTWCCMLDSETVSRSPVSVHAYPVDESPYGVRGLGGNVRTWCREPFRPAEASPSVPSTLDLDGSVESISGSQTEARVFRGGAWYLNRDQCRSAARDGNDPSARFRTVGVRLVRPLVGS